MASEFSVEDRRDSIYAPLTTPFALWLYNNLELIPNEFKGEVLDMIDSVHDYDRDDTLWYVNQAFEEFYDGGRIEVDSNALVSKGEDPGAYVMAWVWVDNESEEMLLGDSEDHE